MDWALLPLSTNGCLVQWSRESEVRFHVACRPRGTSPLSSCWSLRNTACSLVRDLTVAWLYMIRGARPEPLPLRNTHRHMGRTWDPPLWSVREELPGCHWPVPFRDSIMMDAVHPQSGKLQTDRATVQRHMVYSEAVVFWRYRKGETGRNYLALSQLLPLWLSRRKQW